MSTNPDARDHGLAQFVIYQGLWSVMFRDFEREIIRKYPHRDQYLHPEALHISWLTQTVTVRVSLPAMCMSEGMALCPWGALGSGKFQSKSDVEKRAAAGENLRSISSTSQQSELEVKISAGLEKVAKELGTTSVTAVALAYVLQKVPYGLWYCLLLRRCPLNFSPCWQRLFGPHPSVSHHRGSKDWASACQYHGIIPSTHSGSSEGNWGTRSIPTWIPLWSGMSHPLALQLLITWFDRT